MEQQQNAQLDISGLLIMMKQRGASDLFISADVPPSVKVDGKLTPLVNVTLTEDDSRNLAYSLMNEQNRRDFEDTNECNFAVFPKEIGRFRVNVFVQQGKVGMVLRTIEMEIPTIESLHLPDVLKDIVMSKRGMVIFVGATGSGKSVGLNAMLLSLMFKANPEDVPADSLPPESIPKLAKRCKCRSVAYTYTEPLVYYEYTLDSCRRVREAGLRNVLVTVRYA
ncbi:MAG: hypothetical protein DSZ33_02605, partial [Gammaproteobacteria bacterium]